MRTMFRTGRPECNKPIRLHPKLLTGLLPEAKQDMTKEFTEVIFNQVDKCLYVTCQNEEVVVNCGLTGKAKFMLLSREETGIAQCMR